MASARARKVFKYPDDGDESELVIDEQEQDAIIEQLSEQDARTTAFFRQALLVGPLVSFIYYLVTFIFGPATYSLLTRFIFYVGSIIAAAMQGLVILSTPVPKPQAVSRLEQVFSSITSSNYIKPLLQHAERRPMTLSLLPCVAIGLVVITDTSNLALPLIPLVTTAIITAVASRELRPVNVTDLKGLKYDYKGA